MKFKCIKCGKIVTLSHNISSNILPEKECIITCGGLSNGLKDETGSRSHGWDYIMHIKKYKEREMSPYGEWFVLSLISPLDKLAKRFK